MRELKSVAIYCGSNTGLGETYLDAAAALGAHLARAGIEIVYGGTHKGLMGAVADAALGEGGCVHGVITHRLRDKGHLHENLTRHEILPTMKERKYRMIELADAFIALPGGVGTLEEFMEVWDTEPTGRVREAGGAVQCRRLLRSVHGVHRPHDLAGLPAGRAQDNRSSSPTRRPCFLKN